MGLHPRTKLISLVLLAAAGCTQVAKSPPQPASSLSAQARWEAGQAAYLAWNSRRSGWRSTASGLQYHCIAHGLASAPRPAPGSTVTIHYTGTFIDGREFDSSRSRGAPATFPL